MVSDADKIRELQGVSNDGEVSYRSQEAERVENDPKYQLIKSGVDRQCPTTDEQERKEIAHKLLENPDKEIQVGSQVVIGADMAFMTAESRRSIDSITNPEQEYWNWIDTGSEIIRDMNSGEMTDDKIELREGFLDHLEQREVELRSCASLYRSSSSPKAKERLDFLMTKWAKLLEIRSAIQTTTPNKDEALKEKKQQEEQKNEVEEEYSASYIDYLNGVKNGYELTSNLLLFAGVKNLIRQMNQKEIAAQDIRDRIRFLASLDKKDESIRAQIAVMGQPRTQEEYDKLMMLQKNLNEIHEMQNMVNLATKSPAAAMHNPFVSKEEQEKAKIYYAVAKNLSEGKHVPDRILYQLQIHDMVQEYCIVEEIVNKRSEKLSREETRALIIKLSGRQSEHNDTRYRNTSFSPELFQAYMTKRSGYVNS